ncbi:MAG: phosphatase PAP2 family protein [Dermatophilaceae bacterium]
MVVVTIAVYVSVISSGSFVRGVGWSALTIVFCAITPYAALLVLVGRGVVADRHVVRREQRHWPNVAAVVSVLLALAVLSLVGAPHPLVVLVGSQLASLVALSTVNTWTKASMHAAVLSGAVTVVALRYGAWPVPWRVPRVPGAPSASEWIASGTPDARVWVAGAAFVALVGWARVRGGRHSLGQVLLGALIGLVATAAIFGALS